MEVVQAGTNKSNNATSTWSIVIRVSAL